MSQFLVYIYCITQLSYIFIKQVAERQLKHKQIADQRIATNQIIATSVNNASIVVNSNNLNNTTTTQVKLGTSTISIKVNFIVLRVRIENFFF